MADALTAAGAGAAAAALGAATSGVPPVDVIVYSVLGGLASVWISHQVDEQISIRWLLVVVGQVCFGAACGVVLSALFIALAPVYHVFHAAAVVPRWVLAFIVAALIHKTGPWLLAFARAWLMRKGGAGNGA